MLVLIIGWDCCFLWDRILLQSWSHSFLYFKLCFTCSVTPPSNTNNSTFKIPLSSIFSGSFNLVFTICHEGFKEKREMALGSWCGKYGGLPSSNGKTKPSFHMLSRATPFKVKVIIWRLSQIRNPTVAPCFFQDITGSGGGLLGLRDLAPQITSSILPCLVLTLCQVHWPPVTPQTEQVCFCSRTCVPAAAAAQNLKVHMANPFYLRLTVGRHNVKWAEFSTLSHALLLLAVVLLLIFQILHICVCVFFFSLKHKLYEGRDVLCSLLQASRTAAGIQQSYNICDRR